MVFDDKGTKKHKKNNNFQLKKLGTFNTSNPYV